MRRRLDDAVLPIALAVGAAVLSAFLTRALFDWNADAYPWRRIYAEIAFFLLLPSALGLSAWIRRSLGTFLVVGAAAAASAAAIAANHYASPLSYDNADALVVAAFIQVAAWTFALGLLFPLGFALFQLWPSSARKDSDG